MVSDLSKEEASQLSKLRSSRSNPRVHKTTLLQIRSELPDVPVIAIEGIDDKSFYGPWLRILNSKLSVEWIVCGNKNSVLDFFDYMKAGLEDERRLFFIVDRDFGVHDDFLIGERLLITDCYSAENYVVRANVVSDVAKVEFHCHGNPKAAGRITKMFEEAYDTFLAVTKEVNRRLFIARRLGVRTAPLPPKLTFAEISLDNIELTKRPEEIVVLTGHVEAADWDRESANFDLLEPRDRYRGKFALSFLFKWLESLDTEYRKPSSEIFLDARTPHKSRFSEVTLSSLASRSSMPARLGDFVALLDVRGN